MQCKCFINALSFVFCQRPDGAKKMHRTPFLVGLMVQRRRTEQQKSIHKDSEAQADECHLLLFFSLSSGLLFLLSPAPSE